MSRAWPVHATVWFIPWLLSLNYRGRIAEIFCLILANSDFCLLCSLNIVEQSAQSVSVSFGKNGRAVLLAKPFRLDVYEGDQLVVSINARGLLNFEKQRVRKSG